MSEILSPVLKGWKLKLLPFFQDLNSPDVYETSDLPESEQNVQTEQVITFTLYVSQRFR